MLISSCPLEKEDFGRSLELGVQTKRIQEAVENAARNLTLTCRSGRRSLRQEGFTILEFMFGLRGD